MSAQVRGLRIENAVQLLIGVNLQSIVRTNMTLVLFIMNMCRGTLIDHVKLNRIIQTVTVMIQVSVVGTETVMIQVSVLRTKAGGVPETEIDHADFILLYFSLPLTN